MSSTADKWHALEAEFYRDGSLRDIYVLATGPEDWRRMADLVKVRYPFHFKGAWTGTTFPEDLKSLFPTGPNGDLTILGIAIGDLVLNCHFFVEDEIEFDLDPREVDSPAQLDALFEFMRDLACALEKEVFLTPENMRDIRIFRASPCSEEVEHSAFGGFE